MTTYADNFQATYLDVHQCSVGLMFTRLVKQVLRTTSNKQGNEAHGVVACDEHKGLQSRDVLQPSAWNDSERPHSGRKLVVVQVCHACAVAGCDTCSKEDGCQDRPARAVALSLFHAGVISGGPSPEDGPLNGASYLWMKHNHKHPTHTST